ncbi:glycosyltransferase [Sporomusa acidovorans]|uniref:GalNAc(5)-diNAcBac-PP-undecaprenol beta-1,3-glucosyltransferase n=1 Tax=Sporomusa acidovorans (strain ATCC 49682 / DSM 3132 / Mol) TaxID=1123286 RepID=A0ABZ3IYC9_SPOA4|nr:glycosyltransferase [Sporomusa acidovorans]OZC22420.1 GalNAc(5)-diNAcBac-PP-undecaprenol beta-1,3-glucosyltransferase [Sporomusa acidovorans DSM 3132]SDE48746.1 Glycosyltransferase, catalytic subunit of cellulose synthase and poly-beta-1,6-N-acetylglucosamine synthase [Sporomusa acidovorans]
MNPHKICFITCVNDEEMYQESLLYINDLIIPDGFEIEIIKIKDAECITKAYNSAMRSSEAKYKIYMHQDVFIINKDFILNVIELFANQQDLGMIGVAGSEKIPPNGIWWEAKCNYGKVYDSHTGKMQLLSFLPVNNDCQKVQCIDGLIMITQYDVSWRDDIFDGWHFYDISQSIEMMRAGYKVGIPRQTESWCIHDSGVANVSNGYETYRQVFLKEYSKDLFPLVSILIPTYNQVIFLEKALISALNQDYSNCEIVICDDSTTEDVKLLVEKYQLKYKKIKYYNNGGPLGGKGAANLQKCFDVCEGEYISCLLHDDLYMQNKVSSMVSYFDDPNIKLVTSYRKLIDSEDNILPDMAVTQPLFDKTTKVSGKAIGTFMLKNIVNVIGEMSTTLFRKKDVNGKLLVFKGWQMRCLGDVAVWLNLLTIGDAIYIRKPLSCFRIHDGQNTWNKDIELMGAIDWYKLITLAYKEKIYLSSEDFNVAINEWISRHKHLTSKTVISQLEVPALYSELALYYNEAIKLIN